MHSRTVNSFFSPTSSKSGCFEGYQQHFSIDPILENISDGIIIMNKELQIMYFNRAAEQIAGVNRVEATGLRCSKVFRSSLCKKNCVMQKTFATKIPILNKHAVILNSQNQRIPVNVSTSLLRNRYNEIIGCVEILKDLRMHGMPRGDSFSQVPFEKLITRNRKMGRIIRNLSRISTSKKKCPYWRWDRYG